VDVGTPADLVKRHCPQRTVVVTTADPAAGEYLRAIPLVQVVAQSGDRFTIHGRGEDVVARVIQCVADRRIPLIDFRTEVPTLEDVFLEITGHRIRD
jgi:ABC-2 type transport system ATP-binding protein